MPVMHEGVIHPSSPCAECGRVMVRRGARQENGERWPGTVVYGANGACGSCGSKLRNRSIIDKKAAASLRSIPRGPAMTEAQTLSGLEAYMRRRNQRLTGNARAAEYRQVMGR